MPLKINYGILETELLNLKKQNSIMERKSPPMQAMERELYQLKQDVLAMRGEVGSIRDLLENLRAEAAKSTAKTNRVLELVEKIFAVATFGPNVLELGREQGPPIEGEDKQTTKRKRANQDAIGKIKKSL